MPYQKQQELEAARNKDRAKRNSSIDTAKDIKDIVKSKTPTGIIKTIRKINPIADWMYLLALVAAIFKDLLDFVQFAIITYIIIIIATICTSIFIAMMMIVGGKVRMICWIILLIGTVVELIFGPNFLFFETATVVTIYALNQSVRQKKE